jgi:hypothetical protein
MTEQEAIQVESSQRQHYATMEHQVMLSAAVMTQEVTLFSLLKPKIYRDGNQWCVLYGENLQEGVAGFGDTPYKAAMNWESQWHKQI